MNLYEVGYCANNWSVYCFAPTANKAKYMVAKFYDCEYAAMRYKTIKRGMCVPYAAVIDNEEHELYPKITEVGLRYKSVDEIFADDIFRDDYLMAGVEEAVVL